MLWSRSGQAILFIFWNVSISWHRVKFFRNNNLIFFPFQVWQWMHRAVWLDVYVSSKIERPVSKCTMGFCSRSSPLCLQNHSQVHSRLLISLFYSISWTYIIARTNHSPVWDAGQNVHLRWWWTLKYFIYWNLITQTLQLLALVWEIKLVMLQIIVAQRYFQNVYFGSTKMLISISYIEFIFLLYSDNIWNRTEFNIPKIVNFFRIAAKLLSLC